MKGFGKETKKTYGELYIYKHPVIILFMQCGNILLFSCVVNGLNRRNKRGVIPHGEMLKNGEDEKCYY